MCYRLYLLLHADDASPLICVPFLLVPPLSLWICHGSISLRPETRRGHFEEAVVASCRCRKPKGHPITTSMSSWESWSTQVPRVRIVPVTEVIWVCCILGTPDEGGVLGCRH